MRTGTNFLFNRNGNEYPRAFVVRKDATVTAEEVFEFIKQRFASHKLLTGGVHFIDAIPRIPSGKVKKRELPVIEDMIPSKL
jgi:4-coumarate--CoA ligase